MRKTNKPILICTYDVNPALSESYTYNGIGFDLLEETISSAENHTFSHSYNGNMVARSGMTNTIYPSHDRLGSVRVATDSNSQIIGQYSYSAFGQMYSGIASLSQPFGFNGKAFDHISGSYDYGYRDYRPALGRFTTLDPIRAGMNWYAYAGNNGVTYRDILGLCVGSAEDGPFQIPYSQKVKYASFDVPWYAIPVVAAANIGGFLHNSITEIENGITGTVNLELKIVQDPGSVIEMAYSAPNSAIQGFDKEVLQYDYNNFGKDFVGAVTNPATYEKGVAAIATTYGAYKIGSFMKRGRGLNGLKTDVGWIDDATNILNASSKSDALGMVDDLPHNIKSSAKSFIKKSSNAYSNYSVTMKDGNYIMKMTKLGNVPGSWADYYKVLGADGSTINVYKETFDNLGNLVHTKGKL